jgi:hypothetical protein
MAIQAVTFDAYGTLLRNEDLGSGSRGSTAPGAAAARTCQRPTSRFVTSPN